MGTATTSGGTDKGRRRPPLRMTIGPFMLLVAVVGTWLAVQVNRAHSQRRVVEAAGRSGGWVRYADELVDGDFEKRSLPAPRPTGPDWLRHWPREEFRRTPVAIAFAHLEGAGPSPDDELAAHIGVLTQLQHLDLQGQPITDAGLTHLQGLRQLRFLHLSGTRITDASLGRLRSLRRLEWLSLEGTGITDAGLLNLRGLERLQSVDLRKTRVSAAGVADLQRALPGARIAY